RDLLLGADRPVPAGRVGGRPRVDGRTRDALRHSRLRRALLAPLPRREAAGDMVMTGWPRRGAWVPMVCLLWACGLGEPAAQEGSAVLTPDQFIDVYTAIRTAAGEVEDTLAF